MGTQHLRGTIWSMMYQTFSTNRDNPLCDWMANIGVAYTCIVGTYSLFQPVPYGRYSSPKFGPTIPAKLAWMVQESPAFIIPVALVLTTPRAQLTNAPNAIALSLFLLHYFNRSFIFPLALPDKAKPTPITTTFSAFLFCAYNGFLQGHHIVNAARIETSGFSECVGLTLFFTGMLINIKHDAILMALKNESEQDDEGNTAYQIPKGGLFEYIAGANYFGEILEWWAFACYTGGYPQVAYAIFTTVFLGIRSVHHHFWYKEYFGNDYPKDRKAIIPFLL